MKLLDRENENGHKPEVPEIAFRAKDFEDTGSGVCVKIIDPTANRVTLRYGATPELIDYLARVQADTRCEERWDNFLRKYPDYFSDPSTARGEHPSSSTRTRIQLANGQTLAVTASTDLANIDGLHHLSEHIQGVGNTVIRAFDRYASGLFVEFGQPELRFTTATEAHLYGNRVNHISRYHIDGAPAKKKGEVAIKSFTMTERLIQGGTISVIAASYAKVLERVLAEEQIREDEQRKGRAFDPYDTPVNRAAMASIIKTAGTPSKIVGEQDFFHPTMFGRRNSDSGADYTREVMNIHTHHPNRYDKRLVLVWRGKVIASP
jgi:hypothetical protein